MINLTVAMLRLFLANVFCIPIFGMGLLSQITPGLYITSPQPGDAVQGVVQIIGSLPEQKFQSGELSYAFKGEHATTWFVIAKFDHPIQDEVLTSWDTTTITDGIYQLRLKVNFNDSRSALVEVLDIQVVNYTRVNVSSTMSPITVTSVPLVVVSTESQSPIPTQLSANPASIKTTDIVDSLGTGVILGVLSLFFVGVYSYIKYRSRR